MAEVVEYSKILEDLKGLQILRDFHRVETDVWDDPGDYPSNAGAGPLPSKAYQYVDGSAIFAVYLRQKGVREVLEGEFNEIEFSSPEKAIEDVLKFIDEEVDEEGSICKAAQDVRPDDIQDPDLDSHLGDTGYKLSVTHVVHLGNGNHSIIVIGDITWSDDE